METNWDLLIENHFNKKEALAMDMLVEMVEEVMSEQKTPNKGNMAEGVLAAAVLAKLAARSENGEIKTITRQDVENTVDMFPGGPDLLTFEKEDMNGNLDKFIYRVMIPQFDLQSLKTGKYNKQLKSTYEGATNWANKELHDMAKELYNLNEANTVEIAAVGTEDQTGTKADLVMTVDGDKEEFPRIELSIKQGKTKLLAQAVGYNYKNIQKFFAKLGIDVEEDKEYIEDMTDKLPKGPIQYGDPGIEPGDSEKDQKKKIRDKIKKEKDWGMEVSDAFKSLYRKVEAQYAKGINKGTLIGLIRDAIQGPFVATEEQGAAAALFRILKLGTGDDNYRYLSVQDQKFTDLIEDSTFSMGYDDKNKYPQLTIFLVTDEEKIPIIGVRPKVEIKSKGDDFVWLVRQYIEGFDGLYDMAKVATKIEKEKEQEEENPLTNTPQ
jgi:hypothetical protein